MSLVLRDVRVRYKQTALGIVWAGLQPLVGMAVFTIVLNGAAGVRSDEGVPYPVFCYAGLLIWLYFAEALNRSSRSLVTNNVLVSKVYFPRLVAPLSGIFAPILDFAIALVILLLLMTIYRVPISWTIIFAPLVLLAAITCATAFGVWLSALNVEYRDIGYAIPLVIQLWLFLTPVVYPASGVHGPLQYIFALNPVAAIVLGFRWALLGNGAPSAVMVLCSATVVSAVLLTGVLYFRHLEETFADSI